MVRIACTAHAVQAYRLSELSKYENRIIETVATRTVIIIAKRNHSSNPIPITPILLRDVVNIAEKAEKRAITK